MKKIPLLLFLSLFLNYSCQNGEISELRKTIDKLEKQNLKLIDSINQNEKEMILTSRLFGIPMSRDYKINEKGIIQFGFLRTGEIMKYNVYEKIRGTNEKKLLFTDLNKTDFKYEFTPKSKNDNEIYLITEFNFNGGKIEIPSLMQVSVID